MGFKRQEVSFKWISCYSFFDMNESPCYSSLLTGLPQCSAPSPALPGISLFGLPRPHSASLTRNSCSSRASFWSCSFCKKPAVDSNSFSRAKMVRSLDLISSTCNEGEGNKSVFKKLSTGLASFKQCYIYIFNINKKHSLVPAFF